MSDSNSAQTYKIDGMTCEHCAASVREELTELDGVAEVRVDLASGEAELRGPAIDVVAVRRAVEQAGYELAA